MSDLPPATPDVEKRRLLELLLDDGMVLVHLDPRREGVDVPAHLGGQPSVALNLSRSFHLDVFDIDDVGVRASLSFQGLRHLCVVPWPAVFLMASRTDGRAFVFPQSVPPEHPELLDRGEASAPPEPPPPPPQPPKGRPQLRLIKNDP